MKHILVLPIVALIFTITFLTILGAGAFIIPLIIAIVFLALSSSLFFLVYAQETDSLYQKKVISKTSLIWLSIIALTILSILPLPGKTDAITGRTRYAQNNLVRETLDKAEESGITEETNHSFSFTRNRSGTLKVLLIFIGILCAAALSQSLTRELKDKYIQILIVFLTLVALAGFLHQWVIPKEKTLWWFIKVGHGKPLGAFMNRTNHAGFIGMLCPAAMIFCFKRIIQKKWLSASIYGLSFLIICTGIIASQARGAIISTALSILILLPIILHNVNTRQKIIAATSILFLAAALFFGIKALPNEDAKTAINQRLQTMQNLTETNSAKSRFRVWKDSFKIWKEYPVLGTGINGFTMVYPQFRSGTDRKAFTHAENEYIQLFTDTGLLGAALATILAMLIGKEWKKNTKDNYLSSETSLAICGAVLTAVFHNALDFPMHNPLYTITFASLLGCTLSSTKTHTALPALNRLKINALTTTIFFGSIALIMTTTTLLLGPKPYILNSPDIVMNASPTDAGRALISAPSSWHAWYHLGKNACIKGGKENYKFGEECIKQATVYDPNNYLLWEALGYTRLNLGKNAEAKEAFEKMNKLRSWKKPPDFNEGKL